MTPAVRSAAQAEKDAIVFKALANAVRLQIVSFVAGSPEGQVSAGEIVERFDLSQPTISHHLRVLREAGVLTTYKRSTFVYYRFAPQLQETVASVLPTKAAVAPPAEFSPPKRAEAGASGTTAGAAKTEPPAPETDETEPARLPQAISTEPGELADDEASGGHDAGARAGSKDSAGKAKGKGKKKKSKKDKKK